MVMKPAGCGRGQEVRRTQWVGSGPQRFLRGLGAPRDPEGLPRSRKAPVVGRTPRQTPDRRRAVPGRSGAALLTVCFRKALGPRCKTQTGPARSRVWNRALSAPLGDRGQRELTWLNWASWWTTRWTTRTPTSQSIKEPRGSRGQRGWTGREGRCLALCTWPHAGIHHTAPVWGTSALHAQEGSTDHLS